MKLVTLPCHNRDLPPHTFKRLSQRGRIPYLCPQCKEKAVKLNDEERDHAAKQTAAEPAEREKERTEQADQTEQFSEAGGTENVELVYRNAEEDEDEEEEIPKTDQAVFNSMSEPRIESALMALRATYRKQEFYVITVNKNKEKTIMMRRKYSVKNSPDVMEGVRTVAESAHVA